MTTDFETYLTQRTHHGRNLSALTVASYVQTYRLLSAWHLAEYKEPFDPSLLTNSELRQFKRSVDISHVKPATWNSRRAGLAAICEWIDDAALMDGIAIRTIPESNPKWLNDSEYNRLMRQLENLVKPANTEQRRIRAMRDRAMAGVMLFAGLRVFEVTALTVRDVTIGERSGWIDILHGKGDKDARVPFAEPLARKWLAEWIAAAGLSQNDRLFDVTTRTAERAITDIGRDAGLPDLSAHDLRHTFLKRTCDGKNNKDGNPVPLQTLQKLARHTRPETTLRYITPSWNEMVAAIGG